MSPTIRSMKFWINAFIPRDIHGYTRIVPKGMHRGKTMIPGPLRPGFGEYRIEISDCYLTDQRGFSNEIDAKSRVHSEFTIDYTGRQPTISQWHKCDFTTECDCEDGDVECHKEGDTSRCSFTLVPGGSSSVVQVKMKCAASNPCAPTSRLFGDIDYEGLIKLDTSTSSIEFDIKIDAFPAFEAYATINNGAGFPMLQEPPPAGNTVMNLPRSANRRMQRRLTDQNKDGRFDTLIEPQQ